MSLPNVFSPSTSKRKHGTNTQRLNKIRLFQPQNHGNVDDEKLNPRYNQNRHMGARLIIELTKEIQQAHTPRNRPEIATRSTEKSFPVTRAIFGDYGNELLSLRSFVALCIRTVIDEDTHRTNERANPTLLIPFLTQLFIPNHSHKR